MEGGAFGGRMVVQGSEGKVKEDGWGGKALTVEGGCAGDRMGDGAGGKRLASMRASMLVAAEGRSLGGRTRYLRQRRG